MFSFNFYSSLILNVVCFTEALNVKPGQLGNQVFIFQKIIYRWNWLISTSPGTKTFMPF